VEAAAGLLRGGNEVLLLIVRIAHDLVQSLVKLSEGCYLQGIIKTHKREKRQGQENVGTLAIIDFFMKKGVCTWVYFFLWRKLRP